MKKSNTHNPIVSLWILTSILWPVTNCWGEPTSNTTPSALPVDKVTLTLEQLPKNCFGDQDAACSLKLTCRSAITVRVEWKVMFERRKWKQGVQIVNVAADQPAIVKFEFRSPPVAAGVVAGGTLQLRICDEQDIEHVSRESPIWVFPENPFEIEFAWLKQLNVTFVDPEQKLTRQLHSLGFPGDARAVKTSTTSILIVSQTKTLDSRSNQTIEKAMRDGHRILCLASTSGQLKLSQPNNLEDARELPEIHSANMSFVKQIDPRLSATHLARTGQYQLRNEANDRVSLLVQNNGAGWLFLEYGFSTPPDLLVGNRINFTLRKFAHRPQFIYCGLDLINSWDESPTPRYLLAALLKRMCFESEVHPELKDQP